MEVKNRSGQLHKKTGEPLVSIIVPVFNVESYLERCVESILAQNLQDIEVLLIDDGSTDSSGELCDVCASWDERIRVIHKSNEGLSSARNDGIQSSTAPYIMLVDSDDWVEADFCKFPYERAIETGADLVMFNYNKINSDGKVICGESNIDEGLVSEAEALKYNVYYSCYAWGCLYKKNLFENIKYPVGKIHEDVATTHRLIRLAKKIYYLDCPLYNYRMGRYGSITSSQPIQGNHDVEAIVRRKIDDLCAWDYEEYAQKDAFSLLWMYGCKPLENKKLVKIVQKYRVPSVFDWKKKLLYRLIRVSPVLFDFVRIALKEKLQRI